MQPRPEMNDRASRESAESGDDNAERGRQVTETLCKTRRAASGQSIVENSGRMAEED